MILNFNPSHEQKFRTIALAKFNALDALDKSLRKGFEDATSISTAEGYIHTSLELGRFDLASEMISDLEEIISNHRISA